MRKISFLFICAIFISLVRPVNASLFDSSSTLITFEDLSDQDLVILDDQYIHLGVDFESTMRSYRLSSNAPGVDALSGIRTAMPDDDLDPTGYKYAPTISFTIPVYAVGLYLTDGIDPNWLFNLSAYRSNNTLIDQVSINPVRATDGDLIPIFLGMGFNEQISYIKLRISDPINGKPPENTTLSFEIDDLIFNTSKPIPEPSTIFLMGLGLLGMVKIRRDN